MSENKTEKDYKNISYKISKENHKKLLLLRLQLAAKRRENISLMRAAELAIEEAYDIYYPAKT